MRRLVRGLCLVVTVAALTATGCGSSSDNNSSSSSGTGSSSASTAQKQGLKVGFVYVSPLPGSAWSTAWDVTRKDLEKKFGAQTTVVQPIPENTEVVGTLNDLIRKGDKLIFATAFGYQPFVAQVAKQNPDVNFVVTGPWVQKEDRPKNVSSVYANLWEVRYLTGIIAAEMSKKKNAGFVSAFSIPSVVAGINGFEQGVKSVDPNMKTKVVLTSNWYNPPQSTQAAETLAKSGADVIAKHEDSVGPLLGAKAAGVWGIGSEADTSSQTPETYLTGSVYDWSRYAQKKYQEAVKGNFTNEEVNGDLKSGMVKLGPINSKVPASVKAKVEQAQQDIESGKHVGVQGPVKWITGSTQ